MHYQNRYKIHNILIISKFSKNTQKHYFTLLFYYTDHFHVSLVLNGWPKLLTLVPESCCLIIAGIFVGIVFYITNTTVLSPLSSTIFFFCMLPPIIFDAGFFMPNRPFFDHLGTILLFAVIGTIFNTCCIGNICKCQINLLFKIFS